MRNTDTAVMLHGEDDELSMIERLRKNTLLMGIICELIGFVIIHLVALEVSLSSC